MYLPSLVFINKSSLKHLECFRKYLNNSLEHPCAISFNHSDRMTKPYYKLYSFTYLKVPISLSTVVANAPAGKENSKNRVFPSFNV